LSVGSACPLAGIKSQVVVFQGISCTDSHICGIELPLAAHFDKPLRNLKKQKPRS
jgi:hypothetical protein